MNCYVCGTKMLPFCKKEFDTQTLKACEYVKCPDCGLILAKTIYEMSADEYSALNAEIHIPKQGLAEDSDDPHWIERMVAQKDMLVSIFKCGLLDFNKLYIDYGCGDGRLADSVNDELSNSLKIGDTAAIPITPNNNILKKYDKYLDLSRPGYLSSSQMKKHSFFMVLSSAVLEHLRGRNELDEMLSYMDNGGIFAFHTLICEEIPNDPSWFYFLPTHCTFYSNESMRRLYNEFGFNGCAYNLEARMWLFFRDHDLYIQFKSNAKQLHGSWTFSDTFVDYWKSKPYRTPDTSC